MTKGDTLHNVFSRRSPHAKAAIAMVVAIVVLALVALVYFGTQSMEGPQAAGSAGSEQSQQVVQDKSGASGGATSSEAANEANEQIEEDDTPMSSGLDSAEIGGRADGGFDFTWAIVGGIIVVAVFFIAKTARLSSSIKKMNDTFR